MDPWTEIRSGLRKKTTTFEFLNNISEVMKEYPFFDLDSLSKGQLYSKVWLVDELSKFDFGVKEIHLLCGWYGILAEMIFNSFPVYKIYSYDIDPSCSKIADEININHVMNKGKFKSFTKDINTIDSIPEGAIVINTSCEHLSENTWFENIPDGNLIVLQSNNARQFKDHINCVENLEEMKNKYKMFHVLYSDSLNLVDYDRFMIIGVK